MSLESFYNWKYANYYGIFSCIHILGCKLSLFRLCDSYFGIIPADDNIIGINLATFCFLIASYWYLFCVSVIVLARLCVFGIARMSIKKLLCFFFHESYIRTVRKYPLVRNYAAVPVQLEIVILQYIGWSALIVGTLPSINSAASTSFWRIPFVTPSFLFLSR